MVSDYTLQGFPVVLSLEERTLGFLGRITYTCRGATTALQQVLTALTRFAFFAGVGLYHEQGMGTTRVTIEPEEGGVYAVARDQNRSGDV